MARKRACGLFFQFLFHVLNKPFLLTPCIAFLTLSCVWERRTKTFLPVFPPSFLVSYYKLSASYFCFGAVSADITITSAPFLKMFSSAYEAHFQRTFMNQSLVSSVIFGVPEDIATKSLPFFIVLISRGLTRGAREAQFRGCRITAGGRRKVSTMSQVLSLIQYICFRKNSGSNMGAPSLLLAPGAM